MKWQPVAQNGRRLLGSAVPSFPLRASCQNASAIALG